MPPRPIGRTTSKSPRVRLSKSSAAGSAMDRSSSGFDFWLEGYPFPMTIGAVSTVDVIVCRIDIPRDSARLLALMVIISQLGRGRNAVLIRRRHRDPTPGEEVGPDHCPGPIHPGIPGASDSPSCYEAAPGCMLDAKLQE